MKKHHHHNQMQIDELNRNNYSPVMFIIKSVYLALILTFPPISVLVVIWEFQIITPIIIIGWVMFALFWTFYALLNLSKRFIE